MKENETLAPAAAFADFWAWLQKQSIWETMPRAEKQSLYKSRAAATRGKPFWMRTDTMKAIFDKYAPNRYEWTEGFIVHEEKQ